MKIAYNNAQVLMDEIEKTDKLSKAGYKEAEKIVDDSAYAPTTSPVTAD